jgi:hypothetical protein
MSFNPYNRPLKIWKFIGTPTPNWECVGSFPHTLLHSTNMKCDFRALFFACTFANPCFGREPKVRVMTFMTKWPQLIINHGILSMCMLWKGGNSSQFFWHYKQVVEGPHADNLTKVIIKSLLVYGGLLESNLALKLICFGTNLWWHSIVQILGL